MPTLEHNGLVAMFRENPDLAPRLLAELFGVDVPAYATVAVVEASLDQLVPVEFRADLVLELRDADGALVLAVVLEVQRGIDTDKKFSWPVYVAVLRARKRCPACVLVVGPDMDVAAWASEPIELGPGPSRVVPLVLGPSVVPELTDPVQAEQEPELAVLAAVAHGNGPRGLDVVQAALSALAAPTTGGRLDVEHAAVYFHIIYSALREPMKRAVETLIMERQTSTRVPLPPFMEQIIERRVGAAVDKAVSEAALDVKRSTLLRLVTKARIALTDDDRARVQACSDPEMLDRWLDNVLEAKTAADVFS